MQMLHLFGIFLVTLLPTRDSEAFHLTTLSYYNDKNIITTIVVPKGEGGL